MSGGGGGEGGGGAGRSPGGQPPGRPLTEDDLPRLGGPAGLCATCRHARAVESRTSVFVHCGLAWTDPAFPRYPRLPVAACAGHEPRV